MVAKCGASQPANWPQDANPISETMKSCRRESSNGSPSISSTRHFVRRSPRVALGAKRNVFGAGRSGKSIPRLATCCHGNTPTRLDGQGAYPRASASTPDPARTGRQPGRGFDWQPESVRRGQSYSGGGARRGHNRGAGIESLRLCPRGKVRKGQCGRGTNAAISDNLEVSPSPQCPNRRASEPASTRNGTARISRPRGNLASLLTAGKSAGAWLLGASSSRTRRTRRCNPRPRQRS